MTHPSPSVSKLAEANMQRWLNREKLDKKIADNSNRPKLGPYLVISRQCGAGGEEIASMFGERLGWDMVDREILENIAEDYNVTNRLVEYVDEHHIAWLTEMFQSFVESQRFNQEGYLQDLHKLLLLAAQHGQFVMVGRGSQFILPREHGLFVRLHAPLESRVARIMETQNLSEKAAEDLVNKTDRDRAKFLKSYFRSDGSEPSHYDLVVDTSRFPADAVVDLVEAAAKPLMSRYA